MLRSAFLLLVFSIWIGHANGQYAPQVGLPGCDAISGSSLSIVEWATSCTVHRGFLDIANASLGTASAGDSTMALGQADGYTVSLGDSGMAVLTFVNPIYDGEGPDFAVFENAFADPLNEANAFLELAFVEVSSDGSNYFRFPANDLCQDTIQITNAQYQDASHLHNLAGKYLSKYGTPFDLNELKGITGLDISRVINVRIVDVVGSINGHSSKDSASRIINDPYPTPFASGGFDLDAVGVTHEVNNSSISFISAGINALCYPNPASDNISIILPTSQGTVHAIISDVAGRQVIMQNMNNGTNEINLARLTSGMYYLLLMNENGQKWVEKITRL